MTDARRFRRIAEVFETARQAAPETRDALLDHACAGDEDLRAEVQALLAEHDAHSPLDVTPVASDMIDELSTAIDAVEPAVPEKIGRYTIVGCIGRGGMGTVYEATQENPRRTVALKVMHPGFVSRRMMSRFQLEAHLLGQLQHPGIAHIYEAGATDSEAGGQPYFAMELIRGGTLTDHAREHDLGIAARLELMARLCDAVQHAHQKGVIHRDLKPSNILVNAAGEPKILDFGVARATDSDLQMVTMQTEMGQLVGTLPYMSPEQVLGDPAELDTRLDVYALGVMLFELLADQLPLDVGGRSIPEAVRAIREDEPTRLSSVSTSLRGDLDTIVAKALEKDRERRYQPAAELAADIRRHLGDEPIMARPASTLYQLRKFSKRNKALVGGVAATFVALLLGLVGMSWLAVREADQRVKAEREASKALAINEFLNEDLLAAVSPWKQGIDVRMRDVLQAASTRIAGRFTDQPLVEAAVRETLGSTYYSLGAYDLAEPHFQRSLELRTAQLGPEDRGTLRTRVGLARIVRGSGRFDEAETMLGETLDVQRRVLGPGHRDTLRSMMYLARVYQLQSRHDEAEALLKETIDRQSEILGEDHEDTVLALQMLAVGYGWQGKNADAEPLYRRALEVNQRTRGAEHPDTLTSVHALADLLLEQGQYEEAESLLAGVADSSARILGEDHSGTLKAINSLALLYLNQGRHAEAEPLYVRALAGFRKVHGEDHPDTHGIKNNLAMVYRRQGKLAAAEPLMVEALAYYRRELGTEHINALSVESNLGGLYVEQDRPELAEPLLAHSVEGARKILPAGHWFLGVFLDKYGECLTGLGRYDDARAALDEAREILEASLGADHDRSILVREHLAQLEALLGSGRGGD